jgi:uridine kinase
MRKTLPQQGCDLVEITRRAYTPNIPLMKKHLAMIKKRQNISETGLYNGDTGNLDLCLELTFSDNKFWVLFEGTYVLLDPLQELIDGIVYVEANTEERLRRANHRAQQRTDSFTINKNNFLAMDTYQQPWLDKDNKNFVRINNNDYTNPQLIRIPILE